LEVGIFQDSVDHALSERRRCIPGNCLLDFAMDCVGPVTVLGREVREVWLTSAHANEAMFHLEEAGHHSLDSGKVAFTG
jgi:hypothetical protein